MEGEILEQVPTTTPAASAPGVLRTIDLTQELLQPTKERVEPNAPLQGDAESTEPIDSAPKSNDNVQFDDLAVEQIKSTMPAATEAAGTIAGNAYDNSKLSVAIVDMVDTILVASAPYIYESCLSKKDRKELKNLLANLRKNPNKELTESEKELAAINEDIEQYEELMPLSEPEKSSLIEPLKEVLKNINFTTTPQNALVMACAMIAVPRIMPLVPTYLNRNK